MPWTLSYMLLTRIRGLKSIDNDIFFAKTSSFGKKYSIFRTHILVL